MLSATLQDAGGAGLEASGGFYAQLSEGLHAMAQPLTILRSSVAASSMPGLGAERQQRYLELSVQQVERACGLFECLQDMVIARQIEADCVTFDLAATTGEAIEQQRAEMERAGVAITIRTGDGVTEALGDAGRTRQAISAVLQAAVAVSASGDGIEIALEREGKMVEWVAMATERDARSAAPKLDSRMRLGLAVAEMNVGSQLGEFAYELDPLRVRLRLRAATAGR